MIKTAYEWALDQMEVGLVPYIVVDQDANDDCPRCGTPHHLYAYGMSAGAGAIPQLFSRDPSVRMRFQTRILVQLGMHAHH